MIVERNREVFDALQCINGPVVEAGRLMTAASAILGERDFSRAAIDMIDMINASLDWAIHFWLSKSRESPVFYIHYHLQLETRTPLRLPPARVPSK